VSPILSGLLAAFIPARRIIPRPTQRGVSAWLQSDLFPPPIDRTMRRKLVKVLGQLGSDNANVVVAAARQVERLHLEIGANWDELITT
jgi:hypothetical protein